MDALEAKKYGLVDQMLEDTEYVVSVRDGTIHMLDLDWSKSNH